MGNVDRLLHFSVIERHPDRFSALMIKLWLCDGYILLVVLLWEIVICCRIGWHTAVFFFCQIDIIARHPTRLSIDKGIHGDRNIDADCATAPSRRNNDFDEKSFHFAAAGHERQTEFGGKQQERASQVVLRNLNI